MSLNKFGVHPRPGYYDKEGQLVTATTTTSTGKVRTKTTASGFGGGGGGSSGGGPSFGGGFGPSNISGESGIGGGTGFGAMMSTMPGGSPSADVDRYNPVRDRLDEGSVIEDWIPRDASGLNDMFRLMYHRDAIAGTIVDLLADLIWSDYSLVGITDPSILKIYYDTLEAIDVTNTFPGLTREYLVLGRFASSLIFDKDKGIFQSLVSHDTSMVRLTPIPIDGFDPKIDLIPSPALRQFMVSEDPRDIDARSTVPQAFIDAVRVASGGMGGWATRSPAPGAMSVGGIPLDPINTLFVPRKVFNYDRIGTSFFTRLINFWGLEKALINATMTSARRRARPILHVTTGIDGTWQPGAGEMDEIAGMFITADEDPVGAVVTTRTGVTTNEVKSGTDFYKWSDEWGMLTEGKLRALGANDALLDGSATRSNQEAAWSAFMEKALVLRNTLSKRILDKRLFPLLARVHGFKKRSTAELSHRIRIESSEQTDADKAQQLLGDRLTLSDAMAIPSSNLIVPTIQYQKELINTTNTTKLDLYDRLEEKGIPISLQDYASAGGLDLDAQISGMDQDMNTRRKVNKWRKQSEIDPEDEAVEQAHLDFLRSLKGDQKVESRLKKIVGSSYSHLGPLAHYLFWGRDGKIGPLSSKELAGFLSKFDPNSNMVKVLSNTDDLRALLIKEFSSPIKAEIAQFLIHTTGLSSKKPTMSIVAQNAIADSIRSAIDQYASHGKVYILGKLAQKELEKLAACVNTRPTLYSARDMAAINTPSTVDPIPDNSTEQFSGLAD